MQSLSACTGCTLPYLSACTRVHFTLPQCLYKGALYFTSVPVQGCTLPYLSACTRVHFTLPEYLYKGALYLTSVPVQRCTHFTLPQCLYKGALTLPYHLYSFPCRHNPCITKLMALFLSHLPVAFIPSEAACKAKIRKAKPAAAPVKLC